MGGVFSVLLLDLHKNVTVFVFPATHTGLVIICIGSRFA
jgi:hypothetical protein